MFPFGQKHKLETPNCMHFFKVELLADLSCCIVAKDVGLVHELCGSNDLSQVQIRKKVMVKALAVPTLTSLAFKKVIKTTTFLGVWAIISCNCYTYLLKQKSIHVSQVKIL